MPTTPNFANNQFVDAPAANTAFGLVSGAIATLANAAIAGPGLLYPEGVGSFTFSGMVATNTYSAPFGLLTPSGVVAQAHGTVAGSDTQTYSVNFASLVPGTGTVTAYLLISASTVQQLPVGVPGPPPGHPSYNPNFVPTTSYQSIIDTLTMSASTTPANNTTTFEFARTTLTAGQSSLAGGSMNRAFQSRAPDYAGCPYVSVTGSYQIPATLTSYVITPASGGLTTTLPTAANVAGLPFRFTNTSSSAWTISSTDTINGAPPLFGSGSSIVLQASGSITLWSTGTAYFSQTSAPAVKSGFTTQQVITNASLVTTASGNFTVPAGVYGLRVTAVGGGGAGGGTAGTGNGGYGGGGGAWLRAYVAVTPGQVIPWTVGAGGTAGAGGAASGNPGGSTTWNGTQLIANGGGGGGPSSGGSGGAAGAPSSTLTAGTFEAYYGTTGGGPITVGSNLFGGLPGFAWGGAYVPFSLTGGTNGAFPGCGGAGAGSTGASANGGAGAPGQLVIEY